MCKFSFNLQLSLKNLSHPNTAASLVQRCILDRKGKMMTFWSSNTSCVLYKSQIEQFFWPSDKNRKQAKNFSTSRGLFLLFFLGKTVLEYNQVVFKLLSSEQKLPVKHEENCEGIYLPFLSPFLSWSTFHRSFCVSHILTCYGQQKTPNKGGGWCGPFDTQGPTQWVQKCQKNCHSWFTNKSMYFFFHVV